MNNAIYTSAHYIAHTHTIIGDGMRFGGAGWHIVQWITRHVSIDFCATEVLFNKLLFGNYWLAKWKFIQIPKYFNHHWFSCAIYRFVYAYGVNCVVSPVFAALSSDIRALHTRNLAIECNTRIHTHRERGRGRARENEIVHCSCCVSGAIHSSWNRAQLNSTPTLAFASTHTYS